MLTLVGIGACVELVVGEGVFEVVEGGTVTLEDEEEDDDVVVSDDEVVVDEIGGVSPQVPKAGRQPFPQ